LKQKDSNKLKASSSETKLSAYDKQLLEDMRGSTPQGRLTTIDEGLLWKNLDLKIEIKLEKYFILLKKFY
jgi:hypothetical protein